MNFDSWLMTTFIEKCSISFSQMISQVYLWIKNGSKAGKMNELEVPFLTRDEQRKQKDKIFKGNVIEVLYNCE